MIPYREGMVGGNNASPVESIDDGRRRCGAMDCEEAERDEEADERVKDGVFENLADEVKGQVVGPGFACRRRKMGSGRDDLHFWNGWRDAENGNCDSPAL